MNITAIIPTAHLIAANEALEQQGFGPGNFSVPCYANHASHAALHAWGDDAFAAAVKALPHVQWAEDGDPIALTAALIQQQGAQWGAQAPELPDGPVTAGKLYQLDGTLWRVIQAHDRAVYGGDPAQYPALIRRVRNPQAVESWHQPTDQYDSYHLLNPFTGKPDECEWQGAVYATTIDNNVHSPGAYPASWQLVLVSETEE